MELETRKMAIKIDMCPESDSPPTERPSSIMEPYRKGLRLVKFLGLPLKMQITDGSVCFEDYLRLVKCGSVTGNADCANSYVVGIDSLETGYKTAGYKNNPPIRHPKNQIMQIVQSHIWIAYKNK